MRLILGKYRWVGSGEDAMRVVDFKDLGEIESLEYSDDYWAKEPVIKIVLRGVRMLEESHTLTGDDMRGKCRVVGVWTYQGTDDSDRSVFKSDQSTNDSNTNDAWNV